MSQFCLYKNEDSASNTVYPFFVDIQSELLSDLNLRIVIPLTAHNNLSHTNTKYLCPVIELDEGSYVLLTHQMTSVPSSILKTQVTSLQQYRYEILAAIDMLITGI